eukprot:gnl/TRDRNA2_/TRDRNA2_140973_c0_seq1.p1 gnl/TRDRNA2_/TRDRNA2_140973_c0~~gnl/TRDRNA2_/TRDRNA2_140973_c0_seq1.p1  ORF type:complete len:257 (-),score=33.23 gnl/TRDRNA2_/TRDRNA2_140973_c0_seq1:3-773(-)
MVIPLSAGGGGGGMPLMGPPPESLRPRFKRIKVCVIIMIISMITKFIGGCFLYGPTNTIIDSLNIILNSVVGIYLLKDDPHCLLGGAYRCLTTTICQLCNEQMCPGGMTCLLPFMIMNLITVALDILLNQVVQNMIADTKLVIQREYWTDLNKLLLKSIPFVIYAVSTFFSYLGQLVGAWHAWKAHQQAQALGIFAAAGGGDWADDDAAGGSGGYAGGNAQAVPAERPAAGGPVRPPAQQNFVPFGGTGQRLGGSS